MEKRQSLRAAFRRPVQIQPKPLEVFYGTLAADIGTGGIKLNLNKFLPIQTPIKLIFSCGDQQIMLSLNAHVVWINENTLSESFQAGIQFDSMDMQSQEEIKQFLIKNQFQTHKQILFTN